VQVEVQKLVETTSTNAVVAEEARRGAPEGLVVVAGYQSAGRGRFDRRWESPPGASLLFSVLLRPAALPAGRRHLAVAALSLAVTRAVEQLVGVKLSLKWPNDLLSADGRKVAGVLAEVADGAVVVGVGLNVSWAPEGAASLEALAGRPVDKDELLAAVLSALDSLYGRWDEVARLYEERLETLGRQVVVSLASGGAVAGRAEQVREDGTLVVLTPGGLVEVAAGDVEHASLAPQ
jgi:BirA family biotin operon repressor/biotin-[acetyl-CoA-carboxylase] ligase